MLAAGCGSTSTKLKESRSPVTEAEPRDGAQGLATRCSQDAQSAFRRGLFLLHNMMYVQARERFEATLAADPQCGVASWGRAMTFFHPLWPGEPSPQELKQGHLAARSALAGQENLNTKERRYTKAAQAYFRSWQSRTHLERLRSWDAAQKELARAYPDDIDAQALAGLAQLSTVDKGDAAYDTELAVGTRLERLLADNPEHPGLIHYLLHAYDNPALAARALPAAELYDSVAPDAPHALHMPSHIYVRLGNWSETIRWNIRSRDAALGQPLADGSVSRHVLHAVDYLTYGYLQRGDDASARKTLEQISPETRYQRKSGPAAYALAASPARYLLERRKWKEASAIEFPLVEYEWDSFPFAEAVAMATRGLGGARTAQWKVAREALDRLSALATQERSPYWQSRIEIQIAVIRAWVDYGQNRRDQARQGMQEAASAEAAAGKHPVEPGHAISAEEQLGELLLAMKQSRAALRAYEEALARSPKRFHLLAGASVAASRSGQSELARKYASLLVEQSVPECGRPECVRALELSAQKR